MIRLVRKNVEEHGKFCLIVVGAGLMFKAVKHGIQIMKSAVTFVEPVKEGIIEKVNAESDDVIFKSFRYIRKVDPNKKGYLVNTVFDLVKNGFDDIVHENKQIEKSKVTILRREGSGRVRDEVEGINPVFIPERIQYQRFPFDLYHAACVATRGDGSNDILKELRQTDFPINDYHSVSRHEMTIKGGAKVFYRKKGSKCDLSTQKSKMAARFSLTGLRHPDLKNTTAKFVSCVGALGLIFHWYRHNLLTIS